MDAGAGSDVDQLQCHPEPFDGGGRRFMIGAGG